MTREVRTWQGFQRDLTEALPLRFAEFLFDEGPSIVAEAAESFPGSPPASVDTEHDALEIRGTWVAGGLDYFVVAQLATDGVVELIAIEFDLDPIPPMDTE